MLFPYSNIVVGILVFIIGFVFHWLGQLICLINWDFAVSIGIAEKNILPEYKDYELGIAAADVSIGWIYGVAAIGLFIGAPWSYKLLWIPGVIMLYHSLCFWFWVGNQNKSGHQMSSDRLRIVWFLLNFTTGILSILLAWQNSSIP